MAHCGILVKLCDGCMISWDGALLCHCTSIQKNLSTNTNLNMKTIPWYFCILFHIAHNGGTLSKMCGIRQLQYKESMSDKTCYEGLNFFAEKVVDGEIVDFW